MPLFGRIGDMNRLVSVLAERYSLEEIANATDISEESLKRWYGGGNHYSPAQESRLYGFCVNRGELDLVNYPPSYRREGEFDFEAQPPGYDKVRLPIPLHQLRKRRTKIGGFTVNFPFGVSASILTVNSDSIDFYSRLGFDILTYKTVRSVERDAHPSPHWLFVHPGEDLGERLTPPFDEPIIGVKNSDYWPEAPHRASMVNSFGIPSSPPSVWQEDVQKAKQHLRSGQILIVSVTASPEEGSSKKALIDDFVKVAQQAKDAGAHIVEANYSCPNTPSDEPTGRLYEEPKLAAEVSSAISDAIGSTPLFVKIGYLKESDLEKFVRYNRKYIQGIVAINTISVPVKSETGEQAFPGSGRSRAGISGHAIRPWSKEVIQNLATIRQRDGKEDDFDIIGVGGISTPEDVYDYLNYGADAVESCTAAYLNPLLASETRMQPNTLERSDHTGSAKNKHITFASEEAKIAWEVTQEVRRIAKSLPAEGQRPSLRPIRLAEEERQRGLRAIYAAGTVSGSRRKGVRFVPERTLTILEELGIAYHIVRDHAEVEQTSRAAH